MKVTKLFGSANVEVEGRDIKEVFTRLAEAAEIFAINTCGMCESREVVPVVRERDGNSYYELRCRNCGAVHGFGQRRQDGQLFPRRKDKEGNWIENGGWTRFRRNDDDAAF